MFCILLANLRKQAKTPYNLLSVNEVFEGKHNDKIDFLLLSYCILLSTIARISASTF